MERMEQLSGCGYRYYYDDALFPPGTDSFLLAAFPALRPGQRVCDLGCGAGLLGLLLLRRQRALQVTGVELSPAAAALAERNRRENGLEAHLSIAEGDLREIGSLLPAGQWDLVVSNPPYYPPASGPAPGKEALRSARTEVSCTLTDLCRAAARLLRWGGSFCLVHKPERLTDVLTELRAAGLEPKRLRLVSKTAGAAPSLLLAEGRRGGRPGLRIEPPLLLTGADGAPTAELDAIYFRTQEEPL